MFDLGWTELLVIGIVALIVVGPKDLPVLFRNVGRFMGKARGMAREFSRAMNEAADESGVHDVAKTFKTATNPVGAAMSGVKDAARSMTDLTGDLEAGEKHAKDRRAGADGSAQPVSTGRSAGARSSETPNPKLSAEREAAKRKIEANAARAAAERKAREAEEAMQKARELEARVETAPGPDPDKG